jgi:creatinine amidohydrolase
MGAYTNTGVIGRPSAGNADKGRALLSNLSAAFGSHLSALSSGERSS